jgi:hypothetical protein
MNENIIPLVVSVNMHDFLKMTLIRNRKMFKDYYVVTCPSDKDTIQLCNDFNVSIILYKDFWINNSKFNKSGAIYFAQNILHTQFFDKWILLLDSDILLPFNFDYYNNDENLNVLNTSFLYGITRFDLLTPSDFQKNKLTKYKGSLYDGYFQMYFDKTKYYPIFSINAADCDVNFRELFDIKKQLLFSVFHIGEPGAHWNGRICTIWK